MWIRLYDELRSPAHWLDIIRPGEYAVFVMTADSRAPTDLDGRRTAAGSASVRVAPDFAGAQIFALAVVKANPKLCCEIYDQEGKSGELLATVYDESVRDKCQGLPRARRDLKIGAALLLPAAGSSLMTCCKASRGCGAISWVNNISRYFR